MELLSKESKNISSKELGVKKMGSVKDLEVIKKPQENKKGIARFHFSDRYSVFDWGEMPDHIENKGKSLCLMGAYFFEKLEEKGIKTHYRGVVNQNNEVVSLSNLKEPTDVMEIDLIKVIEPAFEGNKYDYSIFDELKKNDQGNFLIPLEIIYRNGLPEGSSVFRRLKQGKMSLEDFGLEKEPEPGEELEEPIYDVSTKLEEKDRYITWKKAKEIASLDDEEINQIKNILEIANETISEEVEKVGLSNKDGKIELGFDEDRSMMIVDVMGTLDECRFTYDGVQISKEIARKYYKKSEWHEEVKKAKKQAKKDNSNKWKKYCSLEPKKMDDRIKKILSHLYMSTANEVLDKKYFTSPPLKEVVEKYESIRREL